MKKAIRILQGVIVLVLFLIIILVVVAGVPSIGDYQLLTVLSGSMQPAIKVGSIVVVNPAEDYQQGDIITFNSAQGTTPTTHRIHEIKEVDGETIYITKGDANQSPDNREITQADIEGKVLFSVPYLGYLVNFARTPRGFLLVVILPAVLVIFNEIWVIKSEIEKKYEKKLAEVLKDKDLRNKTKLTSLIYFFGLVGLSGLIYFSGPTSAYFSDSVRVSGNTFQVGTWTEPGIVINQVYYNVKEIKCGRNNKNEWIELYNNSDERISLKNWKLINSEDKERIISHKVYLEPKSFALLSHDSSTWRRTLCWKFPVKAKRIFFGGSKNWLNNEQDSITLINSEGEKVDFVGWGGIKDDKGQIWDLNAEPGQSIIRRKLGVNTGSPSDWKVSDTPTPGSTEDDLYLDISQRGKKLFIDFKRCFDFDNLKYSIFYQRWHEGKKFDMEISGEKFKDMNFDEFSLDPLFIGTCSDDGKICSPHDRVENMKIHLLYKRGNEIIDFESFDFDWDNL